MTNQIRAEWLKLARRPLTLVLLAVFLILLVLQQLSQSVLAILLTTNQSALTPQVEEYLRRSTYPGVIGSAFGHINGLGGFFAAILAAGAMGSEYAWGTLRTQLVRQPNRVQFLLAKAITIMLLLAVGSLFAIALACLLGLLTSPLAGATGSLSAMDILMIPVALLRALLVLLPYVLLTICFTIMGRSVLVGVAGGLGYLVLEGGFGALASYARLGGLWQIAYNLTIGQNINTIVVENSRTFGLRPETTGLLAVDLLPPFGQAIAVVLLYSASFLTTALYLIRRRDIGGAG
ncbi:MAG: ABC transporter permease subunit [Roseiflexaceae bacterium]